MSEIKNGGPAFPIADPFALDPRDKIEMERLASGMSLRDWFAATVDIPWNAVIETLKIKGETEITAGRLVEYRATLRYLEADAMLRARGEA
ncbi:hypothetical protein [Burkholderia multivorans]|uniref:hypothetical protein n=1 Tax=Burkholderia multivorans TaxID=87883 RepID=UPI0021C134BF|nr:hypothetical protein [Burkholderia multivorans]